MRQFITFIFSLINLIALVTGADRVVVGYWTDWTASQYPTSAIPWDLLTHVNFAFISFNDNDWKLKINSPHSLKELVKKCKPTDTKILISIGGWSYSKYFSPMVADPSNRATFIKNTVKFVKEYQIDGVDFDWEYPGRDGNKGNIKSPEDTANYAIFLKELKAALPTGTLITAAVRVQPFDGPNGPLSNVSEFAQYFDFINVMAYDINGPWGSVTGPNGPLDYESGKATPLSVKQATNDWSNAGIPKEKLVVGVPFYGYAYGVDADMSKSDNQYAAITKNNLSIASYNSLFSNGILSSPLEANTKNGWIRKFDKITKTPWLFNKNSKTFIAYDDPLSLTHKTEYVRCNGYRGAMLWALNNDYNSILLKSLQNVHNTGPCNGIPDTITLPTTTIITATTKPTTTTTTTTTTTAVITTTTTTTANFTTAATTTIKASYVTATAATADSTNIIKMVPLTSTTTTTGTLDLSTVSSTSPSSSTTNISTTSTNLNASTSTTTAATYEVITTASTSAVPTVPATSASTAVSSTFNDSASSTSPTTMNTTATYEIIATASISASPTATFTSTNYPTLSPSTTTASTSEITTIATTSAVPASTNTPITSSTTTVPGASTAAKTSTTATPTSETTSPATTSSPSTGKCQNNHYKCDSTNGTNYYKCVDGDWTKQSCSTDTLCNQTEINIFCGPTLMGSIQPPVVNQKCGIH